VEGIGSTLPANAAATTQARQLRNNFTGSEEHHIISLTQLRLKILKETKRERERERWRRNFSINWQIPPKATLKL